MKFLIVSFALAAVAAAAPQYVENTRVPFAAIKSQTQDASPEGSYSWSYEGENGISAAETGTVQGLGPKGEAVISVQGYSQYTSPEGIPIQLKYRAGPEGFIAEGAHLPVSPPIPEAIARSLAYNAAHPGEYYKPEGEYGYNPSTTYRPLYEGEYSTTPKPYYPSSTPRFYTAKPTYTPAYTPAPFYPSKSYVPIA